ncbi:hypothetical protein ILUMI_15098, partial [Ignelater luminosus]
MENQRRKGLKKSKTVKQNFLNAVKGEDSSSDSDTSFISENLKGLILDLTKSLNESIPKPLDHKPLLSSSTVSILCDKSVVMTTGTSCIVCNPASVADFKPASLSALSVCCNRFNDFGNVTGGPHKHEDTIEHMRGALGFSQLKKNLSNIKDALKENSRLYVKGFNKNVQLNRRFMQLPIHAMLYLGKQELAFREYGQIASTKEIPVDAHLFSYPAAQDISAFQILEPPVNPNELEICSLPIVVIDEQGMQIELSDNNCIITENGSELGVVNTTTPEIIKDNYFQLEQESSAINIDKINIFQSLSADLEN